MTGSKWTGLCAALLVAACGGQPPPAEHGGTAAKSAPATEAETSKPAAETKPPKAFASPPSVGTRATCPVAGEVFTVAADSIRAESRGRHVVLCCEGCKKPFLADPDKYLAP